MIAEWDVNHISRHFAAKLPGLVFVSVFFETRGEREWFKYYRAQFLKGTSASILGSLFYAQHLIGQIHISALSACGGVRLCINGDHFQLAFRNWRDIEE